MEPLGYPHQSPPSPISQCSTAQSEAEESPLGHREAGKWPEPNLLTPSRATHVSRGSETSFDSLGIPTSPDRSSWYSSSLNSSEHQFVLSPLEELKDLLREARLEDPNKRIYIPLDKQSELITKDRILQILRQDELGRDEDDAQSLADTILPLSPSLGQAKKLAGSPSWMKLFAILVMMKVPGKISLFIRAGISDSHLPLRTNRVAQKWVCHSPIGTSKPLECPRSPKGSIWNSHLDDMFNSYQWHFLSPFFDMRSPELVQYAFDKRIPLPIIEDGDSDGKPVGGGFSKVRKVRIHPAHHNDTDGDGSFAVKYLDPETTTEAQFKQEVEALKRFRNDKDPHLVQLLATYEERNNGLKCYHLIFPWANGNLRDFWERTKRPERGRERSAWIAEQCLGIGKALHKIHAYEPSYSNSHGSPAVAGEPMMKRHGDIKPENIVCFGRTLALSDFGPTSARKAVTTSASQQYTLLAVSLTYRAPEGENQTRRVSPAWDIWTLGCVYLEFLVWYLQGWDAVNAFTKKRKDCDLAVNLNEDKFFSTSKWSRYGAYRKVPVKQRIEELHRHPDCTEFIHEFLDLISTGMIRIRSKERMDAAAICEKMEKMLEKIKDNQNNPSYSTAPTQKRTSRRTATNGSDRSRTIFGRILDLVISTASARVIIPRGKIT